MQNYRYGTKQEDRLSAWLNGRGYFPGYSPGSRGPADIFADRGSRHLSVQVKAVREAVRTAKDAQAAHDILVDRLSEKDEKRLVQAARREGRHPAVAMTNGNYFWIFRLRSDGYELLHHGWLPNHQLERN